MDVLIFIGSLSAFIYSIVGMTLFFGSHEVYKYLFFETGTTIITLVLLGNLLEKRAVKQTTGDITALQKLKSEKVKLVHKSAEANYTEISYEEIKKGDLLFAAAGDKIPMDGIIEKGEGFVDESMVTGESITISKSVGSTVIGGTILEDGNLFVRATSNPKSSILSGIIELVKKAQADKPAIQKLADDISAIFVPLVIVIAALAFAINYFAFDISFSDSLLRSVAVLVISCPCAMGLATPTAVMVGIGKAGKNGILVKQASALEEFAKTKNIIFDKTGTLTDGHFAVSDIDISATENEQYIKGIIFIIEQHSSHPIAVSIFNSQKDWLAPNITLREIAERKGLGISAKDQNNDYWFLGSVKTGDTKSLKGNLFLFRNKECVAGISIADKVKDHAAEVMKYFSQQEIDTILLSGDTLEKCNTLAQIAGLQEVFAAASPDKKLEVIDAFAKKGSVAMVGDGINDAPALSKASVAVSFSNATAIAQQSAQIVLMNPDIKTLQKAHIIARQTYKTIKQNLFWAFAYNIVAIPLAAAGFLYPMVAAASMAFSDVVVIGNAIRLRFTKIED